MVFSVCQHIWYGLLYSTILSADNEHHDQAAWLHRPRCARVGLISKVQNRIYGNAREQSRNMFNI